MTVLVLVDGAPVLIAQEQTTNRTILLSNIQNDTINQDMMSMLINCTDQLRTYDDLYKGLKQSEYGQYLNKTLNICDHNALYYYGICEEVGGHNLDKGNVTTDCYGADFYTKLRGIADQPRPSLYIDPSLVE